MSDKIDALKSIAESLENLAFGANKLVVESGPETREQVDSMLSEALEANEHLKGIECHLGSIADTLSRMLVILHNSAK